MKNVNNLQLMQDHLILKSYSIATQKIYLSCLKEFLLFFPNKDGKRISTDIIRRCA